MNDNFVYDTKFKGVDYSDKRLEIGEYDNCTFVNCNFSNSDISNITIVECEFIDCNLSSTRVKNTGFKTVKFSDCKLLGMKFYECDGFLLSLIFNNCQLNFASFYQLKLKNTQFKDCNLTEVDFTETDLTNSLFYNCDLSKTVFAETTLEKVDFRTARNYTIDLELNMVRKAQFSLDGVRGLLEKYAVVIE